MPRPSKKKLTAEQRRQYKTLAREIDAEEGPAIREKARAYKRESLRLREVFRELTAERERQGVSLAELSARSGIDKARLSRLENAEHPNVTIDTIERYAAALGKRIVIALADAG